MNETPFPEIRVHLPWAGEMTMTVSKEQRDAAWALYVELSTRISVQRLEADNGSIREALNSLYNLFQITREVLREAGPEVADGPQSVGPAAIKILNVGIRPFLSKWHVAFSRFEAQQKPTSSASGFVMDESSWEHYQEFFDALRVMQDNLAQWVFQLARIAGVSDED
jgi:hypothetical protein